MYAWTKDVIGSDTDCGGINGGSMSVILADAYSTRVSLALKLLAQFPLPKATIWRDIPRSSLIREEVSVRKTISYPTRIPEEK